MKHNNINKVIIFMIMVGYIDVLLSFGSSQRQYSAPEIGRMGQRIGNEYINLSSEDVFKRARTQETKVSNNFKVFLNDDEFMQKMKTIYVNGLDNASLSTISFKQDIDTDLIAMEALLIKYRDNLWLAQVLAGVVVIAGGGVGSIATQVSRHEQVPVAAVGGAMSLLGGGGLWYLWNQKEYLNKHIEEVREMDKDWRNFFTMNNKK